MKILLVACALLVSVSASAQTRNPAIHVGLFADSNHSVMSVYSSGAFSQFEMWVRWVPSVLGLRAANFQITFPANVIPATITENPLVDFIACGDLLPAEGTCIYFPDAEDCQTDWVWSHRQTCYLMNAEPGVITIGRPEGAEQFIGMDCTLNPLRAMAPIVALNARALNQGAVIAVDRPSWGAIKSLYR